MVKVRVLAIAPYDGLRDELERLASKRTDVILTSYVGSMEWGANFVRSIDEDTYDVILSRGGTAESIERVTNLPVMEVGLSVYDILAAMTTTVAIGRKFAVVGFRGISSTAKVLCDILKYDVEVHTIRYSSDVELVLSGLREKGIDLILGDVISTETARRMGMDAVLITSGPQSIAEALDKAVSYFRGCSRLKQINAVYTAALTAQRRQVVVLAQDGQITYSAPNRVVPAWLHKALRNLAPIVMNDGELRTARSINRTDYYISANRIDIDGEPYVFSGSAPRAGRCSSAFGASGFMIPRKETQISPDSFTTEHTRACASRRDGSPASISRCWSAESPARALRKWPATSACRGTFPSATSTL